MLTREAMHSLAQGIIGSYESRVAGIASLQGAVVIQQQATRARLQELDKAHQAMAQQQHAALAQERADRTQAEAQRQAQNQGWLREVAGEHAGAREEWQKLASTMGLKRGAPTEAKPPVEAVEKKAGAAARGAGRRK